jgi:hypothetical protein
MPDGKFHAFRVENHAGEIELFPISESSTEAWNLCALDITSWLRKHSHDA